MGRYYFNLSDGVREEDDEGSELPDERAAQREAIRFAGEVLRHEPDRLAHGRLKVDVSDADDRVLFVVDVRLEEPLRAARGGRDRD